jgi:hypothetical protein
MGLPEPYFVSHRKCSSFDVAAHSQAQVEPSDETSAEVLVNALGWRPILSDHPSKP